MLIVFQDIFNRKGFLLINKLFYFLVNILRKMELLIDNYLLIYSNQIKIIIITLIITIIINKSKTTVKSKK